MLFDLSNPTRYKESDYLVVSYIFELKMEIMLCTLKFIIIIIIMLLLLLI